MQGGDGKIVYKELSYKIVGALLDVYNELGSGLHEKIYERAVCKSFARNKLNYKSQVPYKLYYKGDFVGINYLDFLVEDRIILEIKKGNYYFRKNIKQVSSYLKVANLKLAILANFTSNGVKFLRILNL